MTQSDLSAVLERDPWLTDEGFGLVPICGRKIDVEQRAKDRTTSRAALLDSLDACQRAASWLADKPRISRPNPRVNSYGLKHVAEAEIGYVTNGAFIAAVMHCGIGYREHWRQSGSVNATLALSSRVMRQA